jgi:hypothetical protein
MLGIIGGIHEFYRTAEILGKDLLQTATKGPEIKTICRQEALHVGTQF